MPNTQTPRQNHLLDALLPDEYERVAASLELVPLPLGHVLYESGNELRYVYSQLPPSYPCSMSCRTAHRRRSPWSAMRALSAPLLMGGETSPNRAVVQSANNAYRLKGQLLKKEFNRSGRLQHLLLRYTRAQMAQTAVCNRYHSLDQQLCRWLLMSLDRLPSDELVMTQELIANMLGVRRESVTEAAGNLQRAGLIRYHRGHITVIDRAGLEARVCECYSVVKKEFQRLLPEFMAPQATTHKSQDLKRPGNFQTVAPDQTACVFPAAEQ